MGVRKKLCCLLCAVLAISIFTLADVAQASEMEDGSALNAENEVYATITDFEIQHPLGTNVSEIDEGSSFYLVIGWTVSNSGQTLQAGDYFDVTLPDTLRLPSNVTDYSFDITDDDGNVVGTVTITPGEDDIGGTVRTVFNSAVEDSTTVAGTFNIQVLANEEEFTFGVPSAITIRTKSSSTTTSTASADLTLEEVTLSEDEVLAKWGAMDDDYEGLALWAVRINFGQSVTLSDVTITDSLSGGDGTEQYVPELFLLVKVTYSSSGDWDWDTAPIDLTGKLTFSDDYRSFTLDLSGVDLGSDQYLLLYRTTYTTGTTLSNSVTMTSRDSSAVMTWAATDSCSTRSSSGSIDVVLPNRIEIIKVDAKDSSKTLSGVKFQVTAEDGSSFELTTDDDGTVISEQLPSGTYTVKEIEAPEHYELDTTAYTVEVSDSGVAVLAVADEPVTTSISVEKRWVGAAADSVTVRLLADGVDTGESLVLTEENGWTASFDDVRVYDTSGNEITYTVSEDEMENYSSEITGDAASGFVITNTNTETADVSGTVAWDDSDDQDGLRPDSVAVNLLRDGTVVDTATVAAGADGTWSFSFEDQPLYDSTDGSAYAYAVEVADVPDGYISTVSGDIASGFTITNAHDPETVSVSVKKEWVGDAAGPVTVHLLADGEDTGQTLVLSEDNGWAGTFDGLDKYSSGEEIAYTVSEDAVEGYTSEVTGDAESGFVITNTQDAAADSQDAATASPSEPSAEEATPKTGDDGIPAAALAAIALATLGTAVVIRRRATGRSGK